VPAIADIRLALFRGPSGEIVTLDEWLRLPPDERGDVSPSWSALSLVIDDDERWGARLSLGALGPLVAQLPQAAERLERGEPAVLRAAVFDVPLASFLLFEPEGDLVVASLGGSPELSDPRWMPYGTAADELYAFVAAHRDELVATLQAEDVPPQSIDRAVVVACLRREAALGERAVELLGSGEL
jgi:hypothetical protein